MKRLIPSLGGATFIGLAMAASVMAAGPMAGGGPGATTGAGTVIPKTLGLSQAQVQDLRQEGLSLAQIADRQKVDLQKLVDALTARWTERIDARVTAGALTTAQSTALTSQVALRAKDMVYATTQAGMRGAAVGAGGGRMGGQVRRVSGTGTGTCGGTGPHGPGRP